MKNMIFSDTDTLSLPVPEGTRAGQPVRIGDMVGVALTDRAQGGGDPLATGYNHGGGNADGYATLALCGSHELEVTGATTIGQVVHILADGSLSTDRPAGSLPFGCALQVKGTDAGVITVAVLRNPWSMADELDRRDAEAGA